MVKIISLLRIPSRRKLSGPHLLRIRLRTSININCPLCMPKTALHQPSPLLNSSPLFPPSLPALQRPDRPAILLCPKAHTQTAPKAGSSVSPKFQRCIAISLAVYVAVPSLPPEFVLHPLIGFLIPFCAPFSSLKAKPATSRWSALRLSTPLIAQHRKVVRPQASAQNSRFPGQQIRADIQRAIVFNVACKSAAKDLLQSPDSQTLPGSAPCSIACNTCLRTSNSSFRSSYAFPTAT